MVKSMSLRARQEMLCSMRMKYQALTWVANNKLLDAFIATTGYERKYAIKLLNQKASHSDKKTKKRGKAPVYNAEVIKILESAWHACNQICSKRIVPFLPELIISLERNNHIHITDEITNKILSISPATFDRLLKKERVKVKGGITTTKPGSLLKKQIKVRTFAD
ncbi:MAG: transposase, partial [Gammaproteobacteria bacterium]|nr:transposase [Gammaproteobacteria bacterium]